MGAPPPESRTGLPDFPLLAIGGFVALVLGSVGTWVTVTEPGLLGELGGDSGGLEHDGAVTLPATLICAGLATAGHRMRKRGAYVALAITGVLLVALVVVDAIDIAGQGSLSGGPAVAGAPEVGIGWGVWVTLLGALVVAADGARLARIRR